MNMACLITMCRDCAVAGVPQDLVPCIVGDGSVGAEVVKQPVDAVSFIGSNATGVAVSA